MYFDEIAHYDASSQREKSFLFGKHLEVFSFLMSYRSAVNTNGGSFIVG